MLQKDLIYFAIGDGSREIIVDMITTGEEEATDKLIEAFEEGKNFVGITNFGLYFRLTREDLGPEIIVRILELTNFFKEVVEEHDDVWKLAFMIQGPSYEGYLTIDELTNPDLVTHMRNEIPEHLDEVYETELEDKALDIVSYDAIENSHYYIDWEGAGEEWWSEDAYNEILNLFDDVEWDPNFPMGSEELANSLDPDTAHTELREIIDDYESSLTPPISEETNSFLTEMHTYVIDNLEEYILNPGRSFQTFVEDMYQFVGEALENIAMLKEYFNYSEYLEDLVTNDEGYNYGLVLISLYPADILRENNGKQLPSNTPEGRAHEMTCWFNVEPVGQ